MKHPSNKQERLEINEKKKREKQSRRQETKDVSNIGEGDI
jgi:hypothetical protein